LHLCKQRQHDEEVVWDFEELLAEVKTEMARSSTKTSGTTSAGDSRTQLVASV